jgi:hypothetical protein
MSFELAVPGAIGTNKGPASDGVLIGQLTATNPTKALLKSGYAAALAYTDDDGVYVNRTTAFASSTADDVPVLPAVPAVDDAFYVGHASLTFANIQINTTTQGDGVWTIAWEYWNGTAWTALAGVTDGTTGFTSATGWAAVTFTKPTNWVQNTVDGVLGYWVRANVSVYTSVVTAPKLGEGYVITAATWIDDTTDFTDADTGDVSLLASYSAVGDGFYVGYTEKFCKLKVTTSQARTGTATLALKYWNGTAWVAVPTADDDSIGWSATAGTHLISFSPPSAWKANTAANGPNGNAGFFVVMELTALTDVTQVPLATQGWVYPIKTGASGMKSPETGANIKISMMAQTASGTTQDSSFILVNCTRGVSMDMVWAKGDAQVNVSGALPVAKEEQLAIVQVKEDGTTEFADVMFSLRAS